MMRKQNYRISYYDTTKGKHAIFDFRSDSQRAAKELSEYTAIYGDKTTLTRVDGYFKHKELSAIQRDQKELF